MDDFGVGASSFGYLKHLTVDYIKIDGQLIKNIIESPLEAAAVRCFIDVADVLDICTVAEFVDRSDILARIREMGVDFSQGYFLHCPSPLIDLLN